MTWIWIGIAVWLGIIAIAGKRGIVDLLTAPRRRDAQTVPPRPYPNVDTLYVPLDGEWDRS